MLLLAGTAAGLLVAVATGWMVAVLVVPAAAAGLPVLLSAPPASAKIDRLEAMEEWTRSLSGVLTAGVGLEQALIATLRAQQPHWSVNSLALEATRYAMTAPAARQVAEWAEETSQWREHLDRGLRSRGVPVLASAAPFVLARVGAGAHAASVQGAEQCGSEGPGAAGHEHAHVRTSQPGSVGPGLGG